MKIAVKNYREGKEHHAWKGDKVGYFALHDWIRRRLGKPRKCEECGTENAKKFEWANISREYKRNLSDWQRLCGKCHMKYDGYKRWIGHILNSEKICHCGRKVMSRELCSLHYNRLNMQERGLLCA